MPSCYAPRQSGALHMLDAAAHLIGIGRFFLEGRGRGAYVMRVDERDRARIVRTSVANHGWLEIGDRTHPE